jgi:hypothetical protein
MDSYCCASFTIGQGDVIFGFYINKRLYLFIISFNNAISYIANYFDLLHIQLGD